MTRINYNEDDYLEHKITAEELGEAYDLLYKDIKDELLKNIDGAIRTVLSYYEIHYDSRAIERKVKEDVDTLRRNIKQDIANENEDVISKKFIEASKRAIDGLCICEHMGMDDGIMTCFLHHDCSKGDCTHMDGEDNE